MKDIENPKLIEKNALPPRSIVKPQNRTIDLSGEYNFRYDGGEWTKLVVPSMWQYHGFGIPRYTNTNYPFPFNPPYVGNYNPIGEYKRTFVLDKITGKTILHFDGVDNCFYVHINGIEVGMAKGSRNAHEFDITPYVKKGNNELYVKVYTYSDASYLEAQDMFLASGIFRDVYLIQTENVYVWDYTIKTTMTDIEVEVVCELKKNWSLKVSVDGQISDKKKTLFKIENPICWNAEKPHLYTLEIDLFYNEELMEHHEKKVGLREVEIIDGTLCLNKTPIKLKGVNRHEYLPHNGRAIDYDTTKKELEILKKNNVNAIRCSHYPNNPFFYTLANEMGFYVMDEADLETHGCGVTGDQGFLSKSEEWLDAYLDRVKKMYERDKNETCILIWSIGNECGKGENLVRCAEYLRNQYIQKPIHYPQDNAHTPVFIDFRQCGYMPVWAYEQTEYETGKLSDKPIIATEFAHGMGNGPGALKEYWDLMYKYKAFAGGFVWEFKNHGFLKGGKYLYGGDFGEIHHALNFNLDGFVFSDGSEKPAMKELAYALAPAQCSYDNGVKILNTNSFMPIQSVEWELLENYTVVKYGKSLIDLQPGECTTMDILPDELKAGAEYRVNLDFGNYTKQVDLPVRLPKRQFEPKPFNYTARDNQIIGDNFKISFKNGMLSYYEKNNRALISSPMKLNFFRKPTDNDGIKVKHEVLIKAWDASLLRNFEFCVENQTLEKHDNKAVFTYKGKILPEGAFIGFFATIEYIVYKDGQLLVTIEAQPYGKMPDVLPRTGVVFELEKGNNRVQWYGRGEHESYADRKASAIFGLYDLAVPDMSVNYERPQENGNRTDTYFVKIAGLSFVGSDKFEFSVHDYTFESLMKAEHIDEIEKSDKNYLYIDYKNRGLGSASCGPQPEEAYEYRPHSFSFSFMIKEDDGEFEQYCYERKTQKLSETYIQKNITDIKENFDCRD